jgi:stage III sporulation protein SpoIIIAA
MMVPHRSRQADVLIQAVQNHAPDVIIVDEIGNSKVQHMKQGRLTGSIIN